MSRGISRSACCRQARPPGFDLNAVCYNAPAREVGGDFYAYRVRTSAEGRRFAFALGDVTGKGVPAALLMAISMVSLQAMIPQSSGPSDLLRRLDQTIVRYTRTTRQNCALVYVEIEPPSGAHDAGPDQDPCGERQAGWCR